MKAAVGTAEVGAMAQVMGPTENGRFIAISITIISEPVLPLLPQKPQILLPHQPTNQQFLLPSQSAKHLNHPPHPSPATNPPAPTNTPEPRNTNEPEETDEPETPQPNP